jgi:hypothetical protein
VSARRHTKNNGDDGKHNAGRKSPRIDSYIH